MSNKISYTKLVLAATCASVMALPVEAAPEQLLEATAPLSNLEDLFELAQLAAAGLTVDQALVTLQTIETVADNLFDSWAAASAQVALLRQLGRYDQADAVVARLAEQHPERADLMNLWRGDTAAFAGRFSNAFAQYAEAGNGRNPAERTVAAQALKQTARLHSRLGDFASAAGVYRSLVDTYAHEVDPHWALGQALLHEALARSGVPDGFRDPENYWVVEGESIQQAPGDVIAPETQDLGIENLRFVLSAHDRALLREAQAVRREASVQPAAATVTATATCTPATAWSGFQLPFAPNTANYGYRYMEYPDSKGGYHPGVDLNWGWGADDASLDFAVVADGCVTDSPGANATPTAWGSATVQHNFVRLWTSQYGHADKVYYSYGAAVKKGWKLGNVGDVASSGNYHLHFEIREEDHPDAANARSYLNSSKSVVGDYYQEPESFIAAHPAASYYQWFDEDRWSFSGSWTIKTGIGNEDDLRYAATTATTTKANYATKTFSVPSSATYRLYVFVPWNYATTTKAPYRVIDTATGGVVKSVTLNQNVLVDAWASLGTMSLQGGRTYRLELATNTGESGRLVALDDVLILR